MTSSQTGIPQQDLLSEPFFQEIMNELEEPVNEETLEKQQRKYRAMKNDLYVFYHEGKQTLLKQVSRDLFCVGHPTRARFGQKIM